MTAFVINGGATTEWDSLTTGSVNATLDSYAISNNTTLRISTDSYQDAGRTWMQWHAQAWTATTASSGFDGVMIDNLQNIKPLWRETGGDFSNVWASPYPAALGCNYLLDGVDRPNTDEAVKAAMALAHGQWIDTVQAANPGLRFLGNAENDTGWLKRAGLAGKISGAAYEGFAGKTWSAPAAQALARQRSKVGEIATPDNFSFSMAWSEKWQDWETVRYGIALCLMDNGAFMVHSTDNAGHAGVPRWYDEYDFAIGKPVDAPQVTPVAGTLYRRKYENAIVLVNGDAAASASFTPPAGVYRFPSGAQDPAVNSGAVVNGPVTLGPKRGRILLCVKPGVHA